MKSIVRGLGLVAACGALLVTAGCAEDNEKAANITTWPGATTGPGATQARSQQDYGKQQAAKGGFSYKSQGYPGASK